MFRSSFVIIVMSIIAVVQPSEKAIGQEGAATGSTPSASLELQPATVVQTPADEGSLAAKASFLVGFNFMTQMKNNNGDVDVDQIFEGMKDANNSVDRKDYLQGYRMMSELKQQGGGLMSMEKMMDGMNQAIAGKELGMSETEVNALMTAFGKVIQRQQAEKLKMLASDNLAKGNAFLTKNGENPKVKTLDNGVQYEVLVEGTGPQPTKEDRVRVDYEGSFINGTVFDSSLKPKGGQPPKPAEFMVAQVVPGFSKALQNMKAGSKWRVVIPGPLGYGMTGPPNFGPNRTLIFEITLLEIMKK